MLSGVKWKGIDQNRETYWSMVIVLVICFSLALEGSASLAAVSFPIANEPGTFQSQAKLGGLGRWGPS